MATGVSIYTYGMRYLTQELLTHTTFTNYMGSLIPVNRDTVIRSGSLSVDLSTIDYFTDEQISQIVNYLDSKNLRARKHERRRYYLLMKVLLRTGARRNEALRLTPSDFDIINNTVRLVTLKKKDHREPIRVLPVHPDLRDSFMTYQIEYNVPKNERLFPMSPTTVSNFFIEMGRVLGFDCHVHKFRHTFAVHAIRDKVPLNVVQKWLGHSSIFTTSVYTEIGATDTQQWMENIR
jgi:integrase